MSRTPTLPPTDPKMWRKLLARTLRDHVAGDAIEESTRVPPRRTTGDGSNRVPFESTLVFTDLTEEALRTAGRVPEPYARLLRPLRGCREAHYGALAREQRRGASYRRPAAIAHIAGLSYAERQDWYRVAASVPLSDRHAGHIIAAAKRSGVA